MSAFPYRGPEEMLPVIERALRRVVDPEVALNIVDVGLVIDVKLQGQDLHLQLTMTSAACPVAELIIEDCERELDAVLPADVHITTELVWEPAWSPERLSESARRFMGW